MIAVIPDSFLEDVARRFALLGDPTRLKVVRALHEGGEAAVGEIAGAVGTSVANTSQHLQRLAAGGIVGRRRDGQAVYYRIIDETIEQLCAIVCGTVGRSQHRLPGGLTEPVRPGTR